MHLAHSLIPAIAIVLALLSGIFVGKRPNESIAVSAGRMLIALAVVVYLFTAIIVPLIFIRGFALGLWTIPIAFAVEILLFAVPIAAAAWWFAWRRVAIVKPEGRYARFAGLVAFIVVPIIAFFATPAIFELLLPRDVRDRATLIELACAFAAFIAYWAWSRYWYRPRHPEFEAKLQQLRERRDAQTGERNGDPEDRAAEQRA